MGILRGAVLNASALIHRIQWVKQHDE